MKAVEKPYRPDEMKQRYPQKFVAEEGLNRLAKHIFVGAMSADAPMRPPLFQKEDKLIITSGDRSNS